MAQNPFEAPKTNLAPRPKFGAVLRLFGNVMLGFFAVLLAMFAIYASVYIYFLLRLVRT